MDEISLGEIPSRIACNAQARYIAPVSRYTYPNFLANSLAVVLFPEAAGPSMATIIFRFGNTFLL